MHSAEDMDTAPFAGVLTTVPAIAPFLSAETEACNPKLATLPRELATMLATLKGWARADTRCHVIVSPCNWSLLTVEQRAVLLGKDRDGLRNKHLIPIRRDGQLRFHYPEGAEHPHQAFVVQGIQKNIYE